MHIVATRRLTALLAGATCMLAVASVNAADPEPTDAAASADVADGDDGLTTTERLERTIRVLQQRPILKKNRLELVLEGGFGANDEMFDHTIATGTLRFHFNEWISMAGTYGHYFASTSDLSRSIRDDFDLFPELSKVRWYAGADVSVIPFDGKFVLFDDAIVYFDIFATIGAGATVTSRSDTPKFTGMVGVGLRLYLTSWLAFTVELRDHIYVESFNRGDEVVNNVVGQGGLSIFIPFGFDYSYPR